MSLEIITPPGMEPVSLDDMKEFMRIDEDDDSNNNTILALITAARGWAETYTRRKFVSQTMRLKMDFFPGYIDTKLSGQNWSSPFVSGSNAVMVGLRYAIVLPFPQVQSITAFTYQDSNGNVTTMAQGVDYVADLSSQPARLVPPFSQMWPVARVVPNAVSVTYVSGYGDATAVPEGIKTAIKFYVTEMYENRLPDRIKIPWATKTLLDPYRDLRF
jgi:hypothetical protein